MVYVLKNARFKMTEDNEKVLTINYSRSFLQYILGKLKQKLYLIIVWLGLGIG